MPNIVPYNAFIIGFSSVSSRFICILSRTNLLLQNPQVISITLPPLLPSLSARYTALFLLYHTRYATPQAYGAFWRDKYCATPHNSMSMFAFDCMMLALSLSIILLLHLAFRFSITIVSHHFPIVKSIFAFSPIVNHIYLFATRVYMHTHYYSFL